MTRVVPGFRAYWYGNIGSTSGAGVDFLEPGRLLYSIQGGPVEDEKKKVLISEDELNALCAMRMCLDPSPLTSSEEEKVHRFMERAAELFGYGSWIEAYHGKPKEDR